MSTLAHSKKLAGEEPWLGIRTAGSALVVIRHEVSVFLLLRGN